MTKNQIATEIDPVTKELSDLMEKIAKESKSSAFYAGALALGQLFITSSLTTMNTKFRQAEAVEEKIVLQSAKTSASTQAIAGIFDAAGDIAQGMGGMAQGASGIKGIRESNKLDTEFNKEGDVKESLKAVAKEPTRPAASLNPSQEEQQRIATQYATDKENHAFHKGRLKRREKKLARDKEEVGQKAMHRGYLFNAGGMLAGALSKVARGSSQGVGSVMDASQKAHGSVSDQLSRVADTNQSILTSALDRITPNQSMTMLARG